MMKSFGRKEGNVLFNNALNTFYLWTYGKLTFWTVREETRCCHYIGYSFRLAARVLLKAKSHRLDNTCHGLCYTSRGALTGMLYGVGCMLEVNELEESELTLHYPLSL